MNENLEDFYRHLLGVKSPWRVKGVRRNATAKEVYVEVAYDSTHGYKCMMCGIEVKLYDHRRRRWRHLDSCNHKTFIEADIPRVECPEHGIHQMAVSWSEKGSKYSIELEQAVIVWLKEASIKAVAEYFSLTWDQVAGIQARAVARGLKRREKKAIKKVGIDETSYQKRHEYVTVILNKDDGTVLDVLEDRKAETLKTWFMGQKHADFEGLESISMDMWDPFINAVTESIDGSKEKIAFDRFHVAQHLNKALDKVRAAENRNFIVAGGFNPLIKTKHKWLTNSMRVDNRTKKRRGFLSLTRLNLKTSRAWAIKETAAAIWDYSYIGNAQKAWKRLLFWMSHSRLEPIIKVGKMIRNYLWGILNAIRLKVNNSMSEAKNARIQMIKARACGFRNRSRFRAAILFHLGGLDLSPATL